MIINDQDNPPDINLWHSDLSYYEKPATACLLQCRECPDTGGDTLWSSMISACSTLGDALKNIVDTNNAYHQLPLDGYPQELVKKSLEKPVAAIHPMVRLIPETGKRSLYVNRVYTHRIEGLVSQKVMVF